MHLPSIRRNKFLYNNVLWTGQSSVKGQDQAVSKFFEGTVDQ